jgi:hypothetical protein
MSRHEDVDDNGDVSFVADQPRHRVAVFVRRWCLNDYAVGNSADSAVSLLRGSARSAD